MKRNLLIYGSLLRLAAVGLFLVLWAVAAVSAVRIDDLSGLSTDSIVELGRRHVSEGNYEDALICFTVGANRYTSAKSREEKRAALDNYVGQWYIYFFEYFDHVNAYKSLSKAMDIAKEIDHSSSKLLLNFGCMYQTLSEQSGDEDLLRKAYDSYREAFLIGAEKDQDLSTLNMAFSNLVQLSGALGQASELASMWKTFLERNSRYPTHSPSYTFDSIFYEVVTRMDKKDFAGAIERLDGAQIKEAVAQDGMARYDIMRRMKLAHSYVGLTGRYDRAIDCMLQAEALADSIGMKDAKLEVYSTLRDFYAEAAIKEKEIEYKNKYLSLKDSVLNYRSGAAISELTYLKKVEDVEASLRAAERRETVKTWGIWIAAAIIVLAAIGIFFYRRHNRNLKAINETLYRNNRTLIENEEILKKKFEELARDISAQPLPETSKETVKYSGSDITEKEKEEIFASIMNTLYSSPEVFQPDFSASMLAEKTGYPYRYISQVINERTGDNFNALINNLRIKEACRHMQPGGKFASFTVDAISSSVGFRSRTSFTAAFKKFTGLTPAKYLMIAATQQEKNITESQNIT